jgi:hypothetical protein
MGTNHKWKCTACGCARAMRPGHVAAIKTGNAVGFACRPHRCDCWEHVPDAARVLSAPIAISYPVDAGRAPSDPRHLVGTRWLTGGGVVLVAESTTWTRGSDRATVDLAGPGGIGAWPASWHHADGVWRMLELEPAHDTSNPYLLTTHEPGGERRRLCIHCGLQEEGPWRGVWCRPAPGWRDEFERVIEGKTSPAWAAPWFARRRRERARAAALASLGWFPGIGDRRPALLDGCWDVRPERG